jgi:hypothetical protein
VAIVVNIPSRITYNGLDGKIHALVGDCHRKLMVDCTWPTVFTSPRWLVTGLRHSLEKKFGKEEVKHTMYNLVDSFTDELQEIRGKLGVLDNEPLGGTAVFPLPFEVEKDVYSTNTTIDDDTEAVTLFVVLKKLADNLSSVVLVLNQTKIHFLHNSTSDLLKVIFISLVSRELQKQSRIILSIGE